MPGPSDAIPVAPAARRCPPRARPLAAGALRPADLLAGFFLAGIGFMLAGAVAGVLDAAGALGWYGHWLALHLVLLGGVSQLILGAGQFFSTAFLATDPPGRGMVRAQLAAWGAGTLLVAVGIPTGRSALTDLGGFAVIVGLGLFAAALWDLQRRSLQRARWAIRWYFACAASLGLGAVLGILMARGVAWPHGSLLGAHLVLNLGGWMGTAIVGTLHTFFPSLTHTLLSRPRLQRPTFVAWTAGIAVLAAGYGFDAGGAITLGWAGLALASVLLAINLAGCARAAQRPLSLAARLVGVAQGFLVAGLLGALAAAAGAGPAAPLHGTARGALTVLLLVGWIGLTVAGSLLHLLSVLHRVRHLTRTMPAPRPAPDRLLTACAALAVAALALARLPGLGNLGAAATAGVLTVAAVLATRILTLVTRAVRSALPRL